MSLCVGGGGDRWGGGSCFLLALGYFLFAMVALVRHDYLLSRNLVGPGLALIAAAGLALTALSPHRRMLVAAVATVLVLFSISWLDYQPRGRLLARYHPQEMKDLEPLSRRIVAALDTGGKVRVVGTFNQFSPGWVRILEHRHGPDAQLLLDAPYPAVRTRSGCDASWSPRYQDIVTTWARDGTTLVMAMLVHPGSPYHDRDYIHWNAWKQNLVSALEASPDFSAVECLALRCGVDLIAYKRLP